ncbi:hypothetical protein MP638_000664 [Amoeboaphelidium occidentale]|nr:hypothetical protein MP638_000664 [Amoeboaphelidium occidentale]
MTESTISMNSERKRSHTGGNNNNNEGHAIVVGAGSELNKVDHAKAAAGVKSHDQTYEGCAKTSTELSIRVAYLGLAFSLLFTGYHVAQAFVTTIYHSAGFAALGVIYVTYGLTSLIAPQINAYLEKAGGKGNGERLSLIFSGVAYVFFILMLATGNTSLLFLGAFVKGCASGLLWISQGVWVNKAIRGFKRYAKAAGLVTEKTIVGVVTGIFFTIFNLNSIIGNSIVIGLMKSGYSVTAMVLAMAAVSSIGTIMFFFVRRAPASSQSVVKKTVIMEEQEAEEAGASLDSLASTVVSEKVNEKSFMKEKFQALWHLATQKKTLLLMSYFICQGVNFSYTYGNYPHLIQYVSNQSSSSAQESTGAANIAWGFLAYGAGSMLGAFGWGKLYDFFHERLYSLLTCHVLLVIFNFTLLFSTILIPIQYPQSLFPCLTLIGFGFGLTDFLTNAIINNSIGKYYDSAEVPIAFSWYRFCFCFGFATSAGISSLMPNLLDQQDYGTNHSGWIIMTVINIVLMITSVISGAALENQSDKLGTRRRSSQEVVMH